MDTANMNDWHEWENGQTLVEEVGQTLVCSVVTIADSVEIVDQRPVTFKGLRRRTTLTLSVVDGVLSTTIDVEANNTLKSSEFSPVFPGILGYYIHPFFVDPIHRFLDKHFPSVEYSSEFTEGEQITLEEIPLFDSENSTPEFRHTVGEVIVRMFHVAFPVYSHFAVSRLDDGFYSFHQYDPSPKPFHSAKNFREFLITIFGTYRKDLAKAVMGKQSTTFVWVGLFVPLLGIDKCIEILQTEKETPFCDITGVNALAGFPVKIVEKLCREALSGNHDFSMINDALEMAPGIPMEERSTIDGWNTLHDLGLAHYAVKSGRNDPMDVPDWLKNFCRETSFEGLSARPLTLPSEFIETGEAMSVCVGTATYIRRSYAGSGFCFRFDNEAGEPYALAETRYSSHRELWYIEQFKGKNNGALPKVLHQHLEQEFNKLANVKKENAYA